MATTIQNLTERQISQLRTEAAEAGDFLTVAICDLVLTGEGEFSRDDYTTLTRAEADQVAGMSREDAYANIVECITNAEAARDSDAQE